MPAQKKEPDNNPLYTRALLVPQSTNEEERSFDVVIATENPVRVYDWWNDSFVDEVLVLSGMEQLQNDSIPLVNGHSYHTIENIVGSCTEIKPDGIELSGRIVVSSENQKEFTKIKEGHINKLSVGYRVLESVYVEPGTSMDYNGKTYTATAEYPLKLSTKWILYEVSLVVLPADVDTKVRGKNSSPESNINKERSIMTPEELAALEAKNKADKETAAREAAEIATKNERARQTEIRTSGRSLNLPAEDVDKIIDSGVDIATARSQIIEAAGKNMQNLGGNGASVALDESDAIREVAPLAIMQRAGIRLAPEDQKKVNGSRFSGLGILGLARTLLAKAGERVDAMTNEAIAGKICSRAMVGLSDYTNVVANIFNKSAQAALDLAPASFQAWTGKGSLSDFKAAGIIQLSAFSELATIADKGAFTAGTMTDSKETAQLATVGRDFILSRQTIINDDVNIFSRIPQAMSLSALSTINTAVYAKLIANGVLSDGVALFHAVTHKNEVTTYAAPTITSIGAGMTLMMNQLSNSVKLGLVPKYLIVGVGLAVVAQQLVSSMTDPSNSNSNVKNPFGTGGKWQLELVVDPNVAANTWYLACDPMRCGTLTVHYLNGKETPTIDSEPSQISAALGMSFQVYHDFGVSVDDYKGLFLNHTV